MGNGLAEPQHKLLHHYALAAVLLQFVVGAQNLHALAAVGVLQHIAAWAERLGWRRLASSQTDATVADIWYFDFMNFFLSLFTGLLFVVARG